MASTAQTTAITQEIARVFALQQAHQWDVKASNDCQTFSSVSA